MSAAPVLLCMGTRPEIIKMAPVYHALKAGGRPVLLLHTGQHREMAAPMYEFFGMSPDISLTLVRRSDALHHLSALLLEQLGDALESVNPRAVLVHGDTSSAAMAALAAFYRQIPVGHVEAGLRSHLMYDPFPEEKNRELIARLASWHFAPTELAREHLLRENIAPSRIHMVGNTIVDAVALAARLLEQAPHAGQNGELAGLDAALAGRRLVLVTAHRRENLGAPLLSIAAAVRTLLDREPDLVFVWPVHANPRIQDSVAAAFAGLPASAAARLFLTAPLPYPETLDLLRRAWLTLTDSGGIQEEAACLKLPVLVLRQATERTELVDSGGALLIGTDSDAIVGAVRHLGDAPASYQAMRAGPNPFGDGHAADRIHTILFPE